MDLLVLVRYIVVLDIVELMGATAVTLFEVTNPREKN